EVYEFTKPREARHIYSGKGRGGLGVPYLSRPTKTNRVGATLFTIGVDAGKSSIMHRLRLEDEGSGFCHFPIEADRGYDEEYFMGVFSACLIYEYCAGRTKIKW